jgi:exopolysaccharide production protein ExoQ
MIWLGYAIASVLVWVDRQWRARASVALWIPGIWMALLCSRPPSFWLGTGQRVAADSANLEGSSVNLLVNSGLIIAALLVLLGRLDWSDFFRKNKWLLLMYFYFAVSALWSDFPFVSFKRWFTCFGQVLIAAVILTEKFPAEALRATFVRVACVLFPLSVFLIRFSNMGRGYDHGGGFMVIGISEHKNALGASVMILGLTIVWDFLESRGTGSRPKTQFQKACRLGVFLVGIHLLVIAQSVTSQICFILGVTLLLLHKRFAAFKNAKQVLIKAVIGVVCLAAIDGMFDVKSSVLSVFGRDATLTGRTTIWNGIEAVGFNKIIGAGYRTFWDSDAVSLIWEIYMPGMDRLMSAHNGYLETYINGGAVGVALLAIWLLHSCTTALTKVITGDPIGKFAIAFLAISFVSNNSESSFLTNGPLWFVLVLVVMNCRDRSSKTLEAAGKRPVDRTPARSMVRDGIHRLEAC